MSTVFVHISKLFLFALNFRSHSAILKAEGVDTVDMNDKPNITAIRLKQIMEERNLTQTDILKMCKPYCDLYGGKMGKSALSQILSGRNKPKQDKAFLLAQALDVDVGWLMGLTDKKKPAISVPEHHAEQVGMNTTLIFSELFKRMGLPDEEAQRKAEAAKELASLSDGDMDFILSAIRMAKGKKE